MQRIELPRAMPREQAAELIGNGVPVIHERILFTPTEPIELVDEEGKALGVCWPSEPSTTAILIKLLDNQKPTTVRRASGLETPTIAFGYVGPQRMLRRTVVGLTAWSRDNPGKQAQLDIAVEHLWKELEQLLPEQCAVWKQLAKDETPFHLGATPFTSGVINYDAQLGYHFDRNNRNIWSLMHMLRWKDAGGDLYFPEYNFLLRVPHGWNLAFPGYDIVHGVTPLRRAPAARRISIVWYSNKRVK